MKIALQLIVALSVLSSVMAPATAKAGAAFFGRGTDTIELSGQTVIGTSCTYEAVILFPSCSNANGSVYMEHQVGSEDKQLFGGPTFFRGFNHPSACCLNFSTNIALDVFHHVAFVYDGNEERYYIDGSLVTNRVVGNFDVADSDTVGHIGAFVRSDAGLQNSFIGVLDSVRLSTVARYTGNSFTPPNGDLSSDSNTVLLLNFNEPPGSTNVVDESPLARVGTLGAGFVGATSPQLVAIDSNVCPCVTAPPGLVAWWPGDGNAEDIAGGHNGTLSNGVAFAAGEVGQAFSFDGTNAFVRVAADPALDVGAGNGMTIDLWINPAEVNSPQPLVEWNNGSTFGAHLWISETCCGGGLGNIYANLRDAGFGTHIIQSDSNLVVASTYQHVALTYDKTTGMGSIYLNGNLVASQNMGVFTPNTTPDFYLGSRVGGAGAASFQGALDEIEIFNRALSAEEIAAIVNAGSAGKCKTPVTADCSLAPPLATNTVGTAHTVTATVTTNSAPAAGVMIDFDVISGPNSGQNGSDTTDGGGQATFMYNGSATPGTDIIQATGIVSGQSFTCTATKVWIEAPEQQHDFAVISLKAPKVVNLKGAEPSLTKRVKVQIQNRSPHNETINSLEELADLVHVEIESLGENCSAPEAVLIAGPPNVVPRTLKPKQKLNVFFDVTYRCANDPAKGAGHEDYRYTAHVEHSALDGMADTHTEDDHCPRPPLPGGVDPNPDPTKPLKDKGCAGNADVLTDVVQK